MEMYSQETEQRPETGTEPVEEPVEEKPETSPDQTEDKKEMVVRMCICEGCPSYKDCSTEGAVKELGFCYPEVGKSRCIAEEKGCTCASCPVFTQMQLKNLYYCTKGSEKDQAEGGGQTETKPAETPAESEPAEQPESQPAASEPAVSEPPAERPMM
jgi:hypothetical protein